MEMKFQGYGDSPAKFNECEKGKLPEFNEVQGGGEEVDPFGNDEKKAKDTLNMEAATIQSKKFLFKVDADGTDMPKKSNKGQMTEKDDHFKVSTEVDAFGTDAGKKASGQSNR